MPNEWTPRTGRLVFAFAAVPVLQAVAAYLAYPMMWYLAGHQGQPVDPTRAAASFAIITGVCGVFVTVAGAVPVLLLFRQRGSVTLKHTIGAGLALGNVPFGLVVGLALPLTIQHISNGTMSQHLVPLSALLASTFRMILIGSTLGVGGALIFWVFGIWGTDARRDA